MVVKAHPFWLHHPTTSGGAFSASNVIAVQTGLTASPAFLREAPVPKRVGAGPIAVEALSHHAAAEHVGAWGDLVAIGLEDNVFNEPGFALSAAQHFPVARRPEFVLIWDETQGRRGELIGLCPMTLPRGPLGGGTASIWRHKQAAFGAPLLHPVKGAAALDALFGWLAEEHRGARALMFPLVALQSATANLVRSNALRASREVRIFDMHERAVLSGGEEQASFLSNALGPKKLKDVRRLHRRLAETGTVLYRSARAVPDVRAATERFLALEASGWKGRQGTALLQDPALATFTRTMTRTLAREGKCRIDSLEVDGVPVAMGVVLRSGSRAFFWKTAYDEGFSDYSPGVQLALHLSCLQLADRVLTYTDSCAIPDHPMINKLWRERLVVADLLVSVEPNCGRFPGVAAREGARRALRLAAKRAYHRIAKPRRY